ncbi:response regulator transcription factor [Caproicibacter fermentans]|uniref:Stage 0 sporulation protein A homolog n=1 Tax=Caproicibacter fermentans TaxID=2576756 RepID=A0A7G8TBH0_9FIRM|nr:response regulator transcription factor [Caproicibacter fermentans]QNK40961.1 response regulator transcription factor [Caproicibacter fermentans]
MPKILVIEDDKEISRLLCNILTENNYCCVPRFSGKAASETMKNSKFDMILLDLMLPEISGEELLKSYRRFSNTPVIIISAKDETAVKVDMLRTGADDYITKPFDNEEVLARVESNLRRSRGYSSSPLVAGPLEFDTETNCCKVAGRFVSLTGTEIKILRLLMENPQKLFTKANLFTSVWDEEYNYDDNAVNTHISNLRRKLRTVCPDREFIETVWGIGYKLAVNS